MPSLRVAVDVGGTFTDICIMDETSGAIRIEKNASSRDPIDGIMSGVEKAGIDLTQVALFSHGTTVATNALITRRLPRAARVWRSPNADAYPATEPSTAPNAPRSTLNTAGL